MTDEIRSVDSAYEDRRMDRLRALSRARRCGCGEEEYWSNPEAAGRFWPIAVTQNGRKAL